MGSFALAGPQVSREVAGGKACNLAALRGALPAWVGTPTSVAVPFGAMEATLGHEVNAAVAADFARLEAQLGGDSDPAGALADLKACVAELRCPPEFEEFFHLTTGAEIGSWDPAAWPKAWAAIKGVWASKYNERSFVSCLKEGVAHSDVTMAVLCQEVVPAKYAFVSHTVQPITLDANQVYVEVVKGLGETLVGNYPGKALSFQVAKDSNAAKVVGYPSKISQLVAPANSFIFRSDSNAEDLDGFAGAGLYDSITMDECAETVVDYTDDPLLTDAGYQAKVMAMLAEASVAVERAMGGKPQDIEGVITEDDRLVIVQSRPQVL